MLIVSYKINNKFEDFLKENGFDYIKTCPNPNLDKRIDDHPDLSIFKLDESSLVVASEVYEYYKEKIKDYELIKGDSVKSKYPGDSIYNIVRFKNFYIHNDYTESNIEKYFKNNKISHLKVKQGYTRCQTIVLNDSLMTADYGIYKTLKDKLPVYLLENDTIMLDGFDQGFLGGCQGLVANKLIFTGDISKHKAYPKIKNICKKEGIEIIYPDTKLIDLGSIIKV